MKRLRSGTKALLSLFDINDVFNNGGILPPLLYACKVNKYTVFSILFHFNLALYHFTLLKQPKNA
jgi:hypothetical protein